MPTKKETRRKMIIEAGYIVFVRDGYAASSLRNIAEAAGVSHVTVLNYFGSKGGLLLEILKYRDDQWRIHLEVMAADPLLFLAAIVAEYRATPDRARRERFFSALSSDATQADHPARTYFHDRYARLHRYMTRIFTDIDARGALRAGMSPDFLARQLIAIMDGLQVQWLYEPGRFDIGNVILEFYGSVLSVRGLREFNKRLSEFVLPTLDPSDEPPLR